MRAERGAAAVELALLLPVLVALLLGMIELGRFLDRAVVLEHAASDAAQAAAELGEEEGGAEAAAAVVALMVAGAGIGSTPEVAVSWILEDELELVVVEVTLDHQMLSEVLTLPGVVRREATWPVLAR